jgi:uncharacterized protein (TIGR02246 family)
MSAAAEEAVRAREADWNLAAQAKDVERFASFYAADASLLAPNMPIVTGATAIREALGQLFSTPGFSLSIETEKVVAAQSGDLAYTQGRYTTTANDAEGKAVTETGKYVVVFQKQLDGAWKVVADIFNSNLSAVPAITR